MWRRTAIVVLGAACVLGASLVQAGCFTAEAPGTVTSPAVEEGQLPRLIPRTVLFGDPERQRPRLSPDGTHLAYLAPVNGVLNVWLGDVLGHAARPVTHDTDRGISSYLFAEDNRHLLYLQDAAGDENWRLYGIDLETGATRDFTPFPGVRVQMLAHNRRRPGTVLLAMNREDPRRHDAYRLTLADGTLTRVARNPGDVVKWVADPDLRVLGAIRVLPDASEELLTRPSEDAEWVSRVLWGFEDAATSDAVAFTAGAETLVLLDSRDGDLARLVEMDVATGDTRILAADPTYDMRGPLLDPDTYAVQGAFVIRDRLHWVVLDEALRADVDRIHAIGDGDITVVSRRRGDRLWLVRVLSDREAPWYFLYNRDTRYATFLFSEQPALGEYTLAPMESVEIPARDGLHLHGYLTFPVGVARRDLPMVLLVHGGPWSRDRWGYHSTAQWLANRGYLCLQVNYRASTGYGKAFVNAGDREWGGAMQTDLVDAVQWAVARGYADPHRIGVSGHSYGGYAALMGAAVTPELFACAMDMSGPANLVTLLQSVPAYWAPYRAIWQRRVGDPAADAAFLRARSPLFQVDRIRIPVLVVQGANDPRVPVAEAEQIVGALRAQGIPHEYLLFEDEGHSIAKPANRLRLTAVGERFLAQHLGGRFEPEAPSTPEYPAGLASRGAD